MFSCEDVSTRGMIPLYSFLFRSLSASLTKISLPSSFLVVARTIGFLDLRRLLRIWAVVSTCFSRVRLGTRLTSKTTRKPSMFTFPSGISLWSNSFSKPEVENICIKLHRRRYLGNSNVCKNLFSNICHSLILVFVFRIKREKMHLGLIKCI